MLIVGTAAVLGTVYMVNNTFVHTTLLVIQPSFLYHTTIIIRASMVTWVWYAIYSTPSLRMYISLAATCVKCMSALYSLAVIAHVAVAWHVVLINWFA